MSIEKYPNIEWSLPLLFQYEPVFGSLVNLFNDHKLKFPNTSLFGSPKCKWTGGRLSAIQKELNETTIHKIFAYVKKFGGKIILTFSNYDLTKDDLNDAYCNLITDIALQYDASFIVSSDLLRDYLREKGAKTIIASVIKSYFELYDIFEPSIELDYYNKLMNSYDIVVIRPEFSKHYLINGYDQLDISKVEVLINQVCSAYCRKSKEHYRHAQEQSLAPFVCTTKFAYGDLDKYQQTSLIHEPSHLDKIIKLGVNKLKLNGRGMMFPYYHMYYFIYNQLFKTDGEFLRVLYDMCLRLEYCLYEFEEYMK